MVYWSSSDTLWVSAVTLSVNPEQHKCKQNYQLFSISWLFSCKISIAWSMVSRCVRNPRTARRRVNFPPSVVEERKMRPSFWIAFTSFWLNWLTSPRLGIYRNVTIERSGPLWTDHAGAYPGIKRGCATGNLYYGQITELKGFAPIGMVEWWNFGMMGLKESFL